MRVVDNRKGPASFSKLKPGDVFVWQGKPMMRIRDPRGGGVTAVDVNGQLWSPMDEDAVIPCPNATLVLEPEQ